MRWLCLKQGWMLTQLTHREGKLGQLLDCEQMGNRAGKPGQSYIFLPPVTMM